MRPVLRAWGEVTIVGSLGGGNRNTVLELRLNGRRVVGRRSRRSPASLDWEVKLLDLLAAHGFAVPTMIPAVDGRRHIEGVVVQSWLDGVPPTTGDWPAAAAELRRLHRVTAGWPQRPGSVSTQELLTSPQGGDVDLSQMPPGAMAACRRAWSQLDGPEAVIHGDPGAANIRIHDGQVGLLDWDEVSEARTELDLVELPYGGLPPARQAAAGMPPPPGRRPMDG